MILRDGFFYPTITEIMDPISCSPLTLFQSKFPEVPEYAEMQYYMITSLLHNNDIT